jgi:hypothetical protein
MRVAVLLALTALAGAPDRAASAGARGFTDIEVVDGTVWLTAGDGSVLRIDPQRQRRLRRELEAGTYVFAAESGFGALWVTGNNRVLLEVDPKTGKVRHRYAVTRWLPTDVAIAADSVWIRDGLVDRLIRLEPGSRRTSSIGLRGSPVRLAAYRNALWVMLTPKHRRGTVIHRRMLQRIDPRMHRPVGRVVDVTCDGPMAVDRRSLWVANICTNTLSEFDAFTGERRGAPMRLGSEPFSIEPTESDIWVVTYGDRTVTRVARDTGKIVAKIRVGSPGPLVAGMGRIWVAGFTKREVLRIDPRTNEVDGRGTWGPGERGWRNTIP